MAPGDAAVTGFSGVPQDSSDQPIDLDGPSLRVISLPGGGDFGLTDAAKRYTATAKDIGQVFGVTLDAGQPPNIFVAATSAYGLALFTPDGRTRRGAQNADYAPGQFGPGDQGGGPNSIWRIDGRTGEVSLFADVQTDQIGATPAALGGLAFDSASRQLFVADRGTGLIHRFTMDGNDQGTYDHGEDGRGAAGLPPASFDPSTLADITKHDFDSQNPKTWGYAPAARRVFALAMHNGRLFYSVAEGPSIWSVGIARDGSFADDPRFEVQVPALRPGIEVSAITFDNRGWMYVAERGAPTGDPDFVGVADDGKSRVKRFQPADNPGADDPLWVEPGDEYAIGMPPQNRNADGGVALSCGKNVWSTGERLLDDPEGEPDSYPHVDGLQGNDISLVEPQNTPPEQSYFVNYYDYQADPESRGHMGDLAVWNVCGGGGYTIPPPAIHIGFSCPAGTFWIGGECMFAPACPEGTTFRRGYCLYAHCPWGFIGVGNRCVKPPRTCRFGEIYFRDRCMPIGCPQNLRYDRRGYCGCPPGQSYRDGTCSRRPPCDPWLFRATNGSCRRCPDGSIPRNGTCSRRPPCDPVLFRLTNGSCRRCPDGSPSRGGECRKLPCDPLLYRATRGTCRRCPDGGITRDGQCVKRPPCENGIAALRDCVRKPPCKRGDRLCDNGGKPGCRDGARGCNTGDNGGCRDGGRRDANGNCTIKINTVCKLGDRKCRGGSETGGNDRHPCPNGGIRDGQTGKCNQIGTEETHHICRDGKYVNGHCVSNGNTFNKGRGTGGRHVRTGGGSSSNTTTTTGGRGGRHIRTGTDGAKTDTGGNTNSTGGGRGGRNGRTDSEGSGDNSTTTNTNTGGRHGGRHFHTSGDNGSNGGAGGNGSDTRAGHGRNNFGTEGGSGGGGGSTTGGHGRNRFNTDGASSGGNGGGNNTACPSGEVRQGRRCVPQGGGGNNGGNGGGGRGGRGRGRGN